MNGFCAEEKDLLNQNINSNFANDATEFTTADSEASFFAAASEHNYNANYKQQKKDLIQEFLITNVDSNQYGSLLRPPIADSTIPKMEEDKTATQQKNQSGFGGSVQKRRIILEAGNEPKRYKYHQ